MNNILEDLKLKFTSGNPVPVSETRLNRSEYEKLLEYIAELQADNAKLQETLDAWRNEASKAHHHDQSSEQYHGYR